MKNNDIILHRCRLRMGIEESQNCIYLSPNLFLDYSNHKHFLLVKEWMLLDGQQAHEKMLNIANHQGNAN